jgi:hypothetical protein
MQLGNGLEEPCQSTNDQWKHWKTVVELHKSKYSVPKPFEIPAPLSSCETGSEELENRDERDLSAAASNIASSSNRQPYALALGTNIPVPSTPLKRPLHDHAPSSPLTDSTTSALSSPIKHGSTVSVLHCTQSSPNPSFCRTHRNFVTLPDYMRET